MSRGLGKMQRLILDGLGESLGRSWQHERAGVHLQPCVIDLRLLSKRLARAHGGLSHARFTTDSWEASFSRAIKGLVARGELEAFHFLVPLERYEGEIDEYGGGVVQCLSDGLYWRGGGRQVRYVRKRYEYLPRRVKTLMSD